MDRDGGTEVPSALGQRPRAQHVHMVQDGWCDTLHPTRMIMIRYRWSKQ